MSIVSVKEYLKTFEMDQKIIVFPAAGNSQSAIELTLHELQKTANSSNWIDVAKYS